jgi:hypothetical protein
MCNSFKFYDFSTGIVHAGHTAGFPQHLDFVGITVSLVPDHQPNNEFAHSTPVCIVVSDQITTDNASNFGPGSPYLTAKKSATALHELGHGWSVNLNWAAGGNGDEGRAQHNGYCEGTGKYRCVFRYAEPLADLAWISAQLTSLKYCEFHQQIIANQLRSHPAY